MNSSPRLLCGWSRALLFSILGFATATLGAVDVKIEFLPPPMEGTLSLGIYDDGGKLVRVLRKEANADQFAIALNGLIVRWDGLNDAGLPCAPGKYHARGWAVGDLTVEGVDFIGNDFVTEDDSPRLCRITAIAMNSAGVPLVQGTVAGESQPRSFSVAVTPAKPDDEDGEADVRLNPGPNLVFPPPAALLKDGQVQGVALHGVNRLTEAVPGGNGSVWAIDGATVKKFSAEGKVLISIPTEDGEPVPVKLASSAAGDKVCVLAQNQDCQRVTAYDCGADSEPKAIFTAELRFSERYEQVASALSFPNGKPFVSTPVLPVALVPNPLFQDKRGAIRLTITADGTGSFLATTDGLPLYHISETPHLRWAVMGRPPGSKVVSIFESDGAVVAEFKATRLADMMAFDAGDVELPPEPSPPLTPSSTPPASPATSPASSVPSSTPHS